MLRAPRPQSAHARRGASGARRLQAPTASGDTFFRLVSDYLHRLKTVYDERFAREYGHWRPVVTLVADTFLTRLLEHIPDKGRVTTRYHGKYANRSRGMRAKAFRQPSSSSSSRSTGSRVRRAAARCAPSRS